MNRTEIPCLFLVVPCYNEGEALPETGKSIIEKLNSLVEGECIAHNSGILFVDDGSADNTWQLICTLGERYPFVHGISFSKNEGHQNAVYAGYCTSYKLGCDAVISIDADLQQDIDAINLFINEYMKGADIVFGIRNSRSSDSVFKKISADLFYNLMNCLGTSTIRNHADYRLLSRQAIEALMEYGESQLFLRGLISSMGMVQAKVYFDVKKREKGKSKYSLRKMLNLALNGVTSFSIKPMHIIFCVGLITMLLSIVMIVYNVAIWYSGVAVSGWASILCSIWLLGGLNFVFLGAIGEYIGKAYLEVKHRPLYFVKAGVNIHE